ncbi:Acyl carrier protein phosphodiesterase [Pseudarcicella hirudinis]|uniref:Acyl carrier protein phosphodiesterase n=1 Tax=Pseudarcicella hirudinis TaxID=1079859 RepID=A0A1I5MNX0_9BACT|nr:ACP phosphodiesterase [Pseudarcicella hirudinis]SFP11314.1 Acyl carrier protein phosphodiesterase [Pseudarcicella hirudinis]
MNYLAHIFLSGDNDLIKLGNFLGDFVRGKLDNPQNMRYAPEVRLGIAAHREIDYYTDSHPVVKKSIERLKPKFQRYSGICIDMFYDHFLARNFSDFSSEKLFDFSQNFYKILEINEFEIKEEIKPIIHSISKRDWLTNYANFEGIEWALKGISRRTSFPSNIENAIDELKTDYELYQEEFRAFFPDLQEHVRNFLLKTTADFQS